MAIRVPQSESPDPISPEIRPLSAVPKPPAQLDTLERRWWKVLWRCPVAATWSESDQPLLVTLCRLYAFTDENITAGVAGQIANISSQLGLNPRSRAQLRIQFTERNTAPTGTGRDRFRAVS